jgi:LCP family protein required for cell wall assembly
MSTLNQGNRRSLDGPIRRQIPKPSQDTSGTLRIPDIAPAQPADEFVSPTTVIPDEPVFVYRKPKKVHSGLFRVSRRVALGLLVLILAVGGWFGFQALSAAHSIFVKAGGGAPGLASVLNITQLKGEGDGRVNILVLGIGGEGHDGPNLSDTIMVVSLDPKTKHAAILSVPRDLYVKIPASANTRVQYGKINSANAYGGPQLAAQTVSNVIGVPIHYYVIIDFSGFRQAIDAVGGVDINVPTAIYDPSYPCDNERGGFCPFSIAAGQQHMDGTVALRYSRSRHSTSDFDRAARQQLVLEALRQKALTLSTLTNPVKLTQLIQAVGSHLKTDIQPNEISKIAGIVKDVDISKTPTTVIDADKPTSLLIGGVNIIAGAGYIEVPKLGNFNYMDIQDMVKNIFVDHYIVDENARLDVQNGSGVAGIAGSVVKSLQAAHYHVGDPSNADTHYTTTVLYDYTGGKKPYTINYLEQRFKVKVQKMPTPTPVVDATTGKAMLAPEIRIILGSNYQQANITQ